MQKRNNRNNETSLFGILAILVSIKLRLHGPYLSHIYIYVVVATVKYTVIWKIFAIQP